MHTNNHCA